MERSMEPMKHKNQLCKAFNVRESFSFSQYTFSILSTERFDCASSTETMWYICIWWEDDGWPGAAWRGKHCLLSAIWILMKWNFVYWFLWPNEFYLYDVTWYDFDNVMPCHTAHNLRNSEIYGRVWVALFTPLEYIVILSASFLYLDAVSTRTTYTTCISHSWSLELECEVCVFACTFRVHVRRGIANSHETRTSWNRWRLGTGNSMQLMNRWARTHAHSLIRCEIKISIWHRKQQTAEHMFINKRWNSRKFSTSTPVTTTHIWTKS